MSTHVKVCARIRDVEKLNSSSIKHDNKSVSIETNKGPKTYTFDEVWGPKQGTNSQSCIYDAVGPPVITQLLEGYNSSIFTLGQTGTGKTYTMFGSSDSSDERGIIPRLLNDLFLNNITLEIKFVEIYNDQIFCLLSDRERVKIRGSCPQSLSLQGAISKTATTALEALQIIATGTNKRIVKATDANSRSSRGHSVVLATLIHDQSDSFCKSILTSTLCLADLAGRENQETTNVKGAEMQELSFINTSLMHLGSILSGSVNKSLWRNCSLTKVLAPVLYGFTKTTLIGTLSPLNRANEENKKTLDYMSKSKQITTCAVKAETKEELNIFAVRELQAKYNDTTEQLEQARKALEEAKQLREAQQESSRALEDYKKLAEEADKLRKEQETMLKTLEDYKKLEKESEIIKAEMQANSVIIQKHQEESEEIKKLREERANAERIIQEYKKKAEESERMKEEQELLKFKLEEYKQKALQATEIIHEKRKSLSRKASLHIKTRNLKKESKNSRDNSLTSNPPNGLCDNQEDIEKVKNDYHIALQDLENYKKKVQEMEDMQKQKEQAIMALEQYKKESKEKHNRDRKEYLSDLKPKEDKKTKLRKSQIASQISLALDSIDRENQLKSKQRSSSKTTSSSLTTLFPPDQYTHSAVYDSTIPIPVGVDISGNEIDFSYDYRRNHYSTSSSSVTEWSSSEICDDSDEYIECLAHGSEKNNNDYTLFDINHWLQDTKLKTVRSDTTEYSKDVYISLKRLEETVSYIANTVNNISPTAHQ